MRAAFARLEAMLVDLRGREDRVADLVKASLVVLKGLTARIERLERGAVDDPDRSAVVRVDGTRRVREIRVIYADEEAACAGT